MEASSLPIKGCRTWSRHLPSLSKNVSFSCYNCFDTGSRLLRQDLDTQCIPTENYKCRTLKTRCMIVVLSIYHFIKHWRMQRGKGVGLLPLFKFNPPPPHTPYHLNELFLENQDVHLQENNLC